MSYFMTTESTTCSGNGIYLTTSSSCICNQGWFSRGDFHPIDGQDCDQYYNAIRGLAIALSVCAGIVIPLKFIYTYLRYTIPLPDKKINTVLVYYGICSTIYDTSYCAYGILKSINPNLYIFGDYNNKKEGIVMEIILYITSTSFLWLMYFVALNLSFFYKDK